MLVLLLFLKYFLEKIWEMDFLENLIKFREIRHNMARNILNINTVYLLSGDSNILN